MVKCECGQEMTDDAVKSCSIKYVGVNGKKYIRNTTYFDGDESERVPGDRCHDCGIENKAGNIHHWGCDMERCPSCGGQLISCDCDDVGLFQS